MAGRPPDSEPGDENTQIAHVEFQLWSCSARYLFDVYPHPFGKPTGFCRFGAGATTAALAPAAPCAFTSWGKQLIVEVKNRSLKEETVC